jgi:hypothetical protein
MVILGVNGSSNATESVEDLPSREELLSYFGINQCEDKSCKKELEEIGLESIRIAYADPATKPAAVAATATVVESFATPRFQEGAQDKNFAPSRSLATPSIPRITPSQ